MWFERFFDRLAYFAQVLLKSILLDASRDLGFAIICGPLKSLMRSSNDLGLTENSFLDG
jgi:hypothetical protein